MRIFFMAVVAILFQLCTYAVASGVQWLVRPWASDAILKAVMIGLFVISNVILLLLITGSFRIGMSYLSVLWIAILAIGRPIGTIRSVTPRTQWKCVTSMAASVGP